MSGFLVNSGALSNWADKVAEAKHGHAEVKTLPFCCPSTACLL